MGVNRVGGQDLAALFARTATPTPAPQLRNAEAPQDSERSTQRVLRQHEEQAQRAASSAESRLKPLSGRTRLHVDEASNRVVAQILDENNEVVKQIPPEELLKIAARFRELQGLLFDEQT